MTATRPSVLISGCSSGIGRAAALRFAQAGFPTYATARKPETLETLEAAGCVTLALDVTEPASIADAIGRVERDHGHVGILVNNAGYGLMGPVEETPLDAIRAQYETNVFGLIALSQAVLPAMRSARYGRVINVGSCGGEFTTPGSGIYQSTKYAVESISDALRMETKIFGIKVVLIQPGGVTTGFGAASSHTLIGRDGAYADLMNGVETASERSLRPGAPGVLSADDVAQVIVKAATQRRPKTRYRVGIVARSSIKMRHWLPDKAWDTVALKMIKAS